MVINHYFSSNINNLSEFDAEFLSHIISCSLFSFIIRFCFFPPDILSGTSTISDASILSDLINVPTVVIGLIWLVISLAGIFLVMKLSYIKKTK